MNSAFAEFAEAAQSRASPPPTQSAPRFERVAILGGGEDARLIAALCLADGAQTTLFSAYGEELEAMRASSGIGIRGCGPVGTYNVDGKPGDSISTTAELDRAVATAQLIFLTGPVHKQRTYAMVLAEHMHDGQVLVLAPGRSLGALETAWLLRIGGCRADVTIVETQGLPYWIRAENAVLHLTRAHAVAAATLPSGRNHAIIGLQRFLPNLNATDSVLTSGFADGSALVEFPALLMSGPALGNGGVSIPMGGTPLDDSHTFGALIGQEQQQIISRLAEERREVARCFGVRELPDTGDWIDVHAGDMKGDASRPVPDADCARRLLRDGVVGSLVPLVSAAKMAGRKVPVTDSMITLASAVLGADVAAAGRRLDTIGIEAGDMDAARQAMDAIATGSLHNGR